MRVANRHTQGQPAGLPRVSVATTTYRHEAFIGDAIEGVLMQDTDFPVEMVIGEDCSPDGTRSVIQKYMQKYPGLIRLSNYERNVGSARNSLMTIGRCRGEYIALLDGDDYWTAPHKLRKQVDLLDRDHAFSMCFHAVNRVRGNCIVKKIVQPTGHRSVYRLADLAHWVNISTSSMLFRRSAVPRFPSWYSKVTQGDWATQMLLAEKGDIAYIPEIMATHRLHETNVWSGRLRPRSEVLREQIREVEEFRRHLGDARARPFERSQYRRRYELVHVFLDEGKLLQAQKTLQACYGASGYNPRVDLLEPWLCLLHMRAPRLYELLHMDAILLNRMLHRAWGRFVRPVLEMRRPWVECRRPRERDRHA